MKFRRTPVFCQIQEPLVDEVLDYLSDLKTLPDLCLVIGSSMKLLDALCTHWTGRMEIIVVFSPEFVGDVSEVAETIAMSEGLELADLIWVCQEDRPLCTHSQLRLSLTAGAGNARDLANRLSRSLRLP